MIFLDFVQRFQFNFTLTALQSSLEKYFNLTLR